MPGSPRSPRHHCPSTSAATPARAAGVLVVVFVLLAAACGKGGGDSVNADKTVDSQAGLNTDESSVPDSTAAKVETVPGMPPVIDPSNIYSETATPNPVTKDAKYLVYVPNEASGTLTVIDPATKKVIGTYQTGVVPQHVVPSYDMTKLYVLNNTSNSLTPIDPLTGQPGKSIPVHDPYNLYYTPDGSEAIIVAEAELRLDFADPDTFEVRSSIETDCDGINHIDYSADGRYFIATCEFNGELIKVDTVAKKVVGTLKIDISTSGVQNPIKPIAQPQDVRVANDGKVFYIADLITNGVYVIDGESFTQIGFIPAGIGTHGLYPSRDGTKLYIVNRGTSSIPPVGSFKGKAKGSISVLDFATRTIEATWDMPGGGSPDMGNLTPDGKELWLGGRYDAEVYVFDTQAGKLVARIPAGQNPHGLTVWPQPGRYSFGHTGNVR